MHSPPAPKLVQRFVDDFVALGGDVGGWIGLAVSGGPDSLALLLLAHAAKLNIEAATVDHGLRPASTGEAAFVAAICGDLDVPHTTLTLGPHDRGNVSDWARRERYRALEEWADERDIRWILTAHHADDQLETMLMRLNRGSGVAGLAGIRRRTERIARPLLGWRRAELAEIVRDSGIEPVDDPSNRDHRYDRARLRKALGGAGWLDAQAASRSAAALADAEEALSWSAREVARRRVAEGDGGSIVFDPRDLPHELLRRVFLSCIRRISSAADPRSESVERAIAALQGGGVVTLAGVKCVGGERWRFSPAPPRRASTEGSS